MLSNAYFLAEFRFDTAENEPAKNLQNFANFPNFADFAVVSARPPSAIFRTGIRRAVRVVARVVATFWQIFGEFSLVFGLYRHRSLQVKTRFSALLEIYKII